MTKYILELNEEQYNLIETCCEVMHRFMCGDTRELAQMFPTDVLKREEPLLQELRAKMFPELQRGQEYDWQGGHPNKILDKMQAGTYQIYREMVHKRFLHNIAMGKTKSGWSCYDSPTLRTEKFSTPKITILEGNE